MHLERHLKEMNGQVCSWNSFLLPKPDIIHVEHTKINSLKSKWCISCAEYYVIN